MSAFNREAKTVESKQKFIFLLKKPLTEEESTQLYNELQTKNYEKFTSQANIVSQFQNCEAILFDCENPEHVKYYFDNRQYIVENKYVVIYKKEKGKHLSDEEIDEIKKKWKCNYVRKNIVGKFSNKTDYILRYLMNDHQGKINRSCIYSIIDLIMSFFKKQ